MATENEKLLWTQNGVESVRDIEKQRRQQAEAKKEELRQLVGRRYRVLLESADWIGEMKDLSKHALSQLDQVSLGVAQLEKRKGLGSKHSKRQPTKPEGTPDWMTGLGLDCGEPSRVLSHIVRLPEKIWEVLRVHEFMRASELYFQALGLVDWMAGMRPRDPMLERHTLTIKQFPCLIVRQCKKRLKTRNLPLQEQTKALCAIWMLASMPLVEVVKLYFDCRTASIAFVFQAALRALSIDSKTNEASLQSRADTVVAAIEDVARLLQSSVQHAAIIFGPVSLANRLKKDAGPSESLHLSLQRFRADFAPAFLAIVDKYSGAREGPSELQELGGAWMKEILVSVSSGCSRLLDHLERGQHIGRARDALLACVGTAEVTAESKPRQDAWRQACNVVLGRSVALWEDAFLAPFQARFKAIISLSFSRLSLDSLLEAVTVPVAPVLGPFDGPQAQDRWAKAFKVVPVGNLRRRAKGEGGSRGLSGSRDDELLEICRQFNDQLTLVVSDVSHILQLPPPGSVEQKGLPERGLKALLRLELRPFVHTTCTETVARLTNAMRSRLTGLEAQILEAGPRSPLSLVDQAVFVSRVCAYLLASSKPLKELAALEISDTEARSFVQQSLHNVGRAGLAIWTRFTAFTLADFFRLALEAWVQQWRVSVTQPVSHPVDHTHSISVPAQPSSYASQFLFQLMDEVYRVHGHFVSQEVLACVIADVTASVLSVLTDFTQAHASQLTEHAALQLVFDIKYLFSVLRLPKAMREGDPSPRELLFSVLQMIEAVVDPIDYALAGPIISGRVAQLMLTSAVMFGLLVRVNPFPEPFPSASISTEPPKQEGSALSVAPPIPRVQTFPIKLYPSKKSKAAVEALVKEDMKVPPRLTSTSSACTPGTSTSSFKVPPTIGALGDKLGKTKEFLGKFGLSY